jgi:Type IX secretion system protein PorV
MFFSKKTFVSFLLIGLISHLSAPKSNAQTSVIGQSNDRRVITTAVPFLAISPDARSAGMGDVGVAISADANAIHWNPSKLAFAQKDMSLSISYTPWLRNLVPDMSISYLSGYKRINKRGVAGVSIRYFDLGTMQFTDVNGQVLQDFNPREMAIDLSYAMQLSNNFSMAVTGRFINSNLTGNVSKVNINASPGYSLAADISLYYHKDVMLSGMKTKVAMGANISNIGQKITYNSVANADFIPTNMRVGGAWTIELDQYNKITWALDANKLMVPSPPIYGPNQQIIKGQDPQRPFRAFLVPSPMRPMALAKS